MFTAPGNNNRRGSAPVFFFGGGGIFMGVLPLTNDTGKTSVGKDLVKIRSAVADQSRQKKKRKKTIKNKTATKT